MRRSSQFRQRKRGKSDGFITMKRNGVLMKQLASFLVKLQDYEWCRSVCCPLRYAMVAPFQMTQINARGRRPGGESSACQWRKGGRIEMSENEFRIRSGFIHPQSWLSLASDSIRTILGCNDFVFMVRLRWRWCWLAESKFLLVVLNRNLLGECCCYFLVGRNFCRLVCIVKYCTLNCNCYRHRIEYEDRKSDQTRGQFVAGADL